MPSWTGWKPLRTNGKPQRMRRIVFSEAAREDRNEIIAHSIETFGGHQARRLRIRFERIINALAASPWIGHLREDLDPPGRTFRYFVAMKLFTIVYEPAEDGIRVARILHGMRNLPAELGRDAGDDDG